jgi:hypothetical protein
MGTPVSGLMSYGLANLPLLSVPRWMETVVSSTYMLTPPSLVMMSVNPPKLMMAPPLNVMPYAFLIVLASNWKPPASPPPCQLPNVKAALILYDPPANRVFVSGGMIALVSRGIEIR